MADNPPVLTRRALGRVAAVAGAALLAGCSAAAPATGPTDAAAPTGSAPGSRDPDETGSATADAGANVADAAGTVSVEIGTAPGAQEFRYDKPTVAVPSGARIKLRFTNNTDPKDEVGHNWVLVKPGQEAAVVAGGQAAGDTADWLKTDDPAVLAHTRLIEGGQSNTIRFTAPPRGDYSFLCTFPDHFTRGQKGTLTVT